MNNKYIMWNNPLNVDNAALSLKKDKLVIGTTDTVLGLFAAANKKGFDLLNRVKDRKGKPYLLIASSPLSINHLIDQEKTFHIEKLMENFWPGPLTVIFKASHNAPSYFLSDKKTIAIRIPDHKGMLQLLESNSLLFSTSANKSGEDLPVTVKQLNPLLAKDAEYIIDDAAHEDKSVPSTLIDCSQFTENNPIITVLRKGKISLQELKDVLGKDVIFN